jgi:hypothetical protein
MGRIRSSYVVASLVIGLGAFALGARPGIPASSASQERVAPDERAATEQIRDLLEAQVREGFRKDGPPAKRDAHAKAQGCVKARFTVERALPATLRRGIFARPATYTAWIRFSNAVGSDDRSGLARGMAIKLTGVPGRKLLPAEANARTQDLLLVNYPVFNIRTASDYVQFFEANRAGTVDAFFAKHPRAGALTAALAAQRIGNPLLLRYFSMTPYALGDRYVKYSAEPVSCATRTVLHDAPPNPLPDDPNYLREAMTATLAHGAACYTFMLQLQTDPATMPIEDSTVLWSEARSPFVAVASIDMPEQRFDSPAQRRFCENLSYTPWHSLPANRPVGVINRIRRVVYDAISTLRHRLNGVARREPSGNESFEGSPTW